METLIELLKHSIEKNWVKPLTNKRLLNILILARKQEEYDEKWASMPDPIDYYG